jgi:hypothetical protein
VISARRDWRWWLPWRLGLLVVGLACTGGVTANSAYWWGYSKRMDAAGPVAEVWIGGSPVASPGGEVRLEVEVIDGSGGEARTEEVVIDGVPEPGVVGLIGVGVMVVALRRRRGVRGGQ